MNRANLISHISVVFFVFCCTSSQAAELSPSPPQFHQAFAQLKTLEGTWDEEEYGRVIEYHLTGDDSALIEEFIGDPPMTSVYHLDGVDLRMTHYCNAENQPRMIASSYDSDTLHFSFVDVSNLESPHAYHTRTLRIEFLTENSVVLTFTGLRSGEEVVTTHTLTRRQTQIFSGGE